LRTEYLHYAEKKLTFKVCHESNEHRYLTNSTFDPDGFRIIVGNFLIIFEFSLCWSFAG